MYEDDGEATGAFCNRLGFVAVFLQDNSFD